MPRLAANLGFLFTEQPFLDRFGPAKRAGFEGVGVRVIVEEVNFLKSLVDEFSRFARLPRMRPEPTDLSTLALSAVRLFDGAREVLPVVAR